jgi:endogenous inhibitor of DNA gyrase (YacG/DUF329 family)
MPDTSKNKAKCPFCSHRFAALEAVRKDGIDHCPKCDKAVVWTQTLYPVAGKVAWNKY